MRVINYTAFLVVFLLFSCNRIETYETLKKEDIEYVRSMKLLDTDEVIYGFYSEYKKKVAGNFYTNKRFAKYWIDEYNAQKNVVYSAYYADVVSVDTIYYVGLTYTPYMLIHQKDGTQFRLCVDGDQEEVKAFFEDAISKWKTMYKKN